MNRVGELVNADVLGRIRIAGEGEQVFLGTTNGRTLGRGAETARAAVPVNLRHEIAVFRHVGGELIPRHDREAYLVRGHGVQDVLALAEQVPDNPRRLAHRRVGDIGRADDGQAANDDRFGVKRRELELPPHRLRHRTNFVRRT